MGGVGVAIERPRGDDDVTVIVLLPPLRLVGCLSALLSG